MIFKKYSILIIPIFVTLVFISTTTCQLKDAKDDFSWRLTEDYYIHAIENTQDYRDMLKRKWEDKVPGLKELREIIRESIKIMMNIYVKEEHISRNILNVDKFVRRMMEITEERHEANTEEFITRMRMLREQKIRTGEVVNKTRQPEEYSQEEKDELKEHFNIFIEMQNESEFIMKMGYHLLKELLEVNVDEPVENDNPYINYIIDSIEDEESPLKLYKDNNDNNVDDDDEDLLISFNEEFIKNERLRLRKEDEQNRKIHQARKSLEYTMEEKEEIKKRLLDFINERNAKNKTRLINSFKNLYLQEDQFIRAIESPLDIKVYIKELGQILIEIEPEMKEIRDKFVANKLIKISGTHVFGSGEQAKEKHTKFAKWLINNFNEKDKSYQEKFVTEERTRRLNNINKRLRENKQMTPKQYSVIEKLELRKRWDIFKDKMYKEEQENDSEIVDQIEAMKYLENNIQPKEESGDKFLIDYLIDVIEETPKYLATMAGEKKFSEKIEKHRDKFENVDEFKEYEKVEDAFIEKERERLKIIRQKNKNFKARSPNEYSQKEIDELMERFSIFRLEVKLEEERKEKKDNDKEKESIDALKSNKNDIYSHINNLIDEIEDSYLYKVYTSDAFKKEREEDLAEEMENIKNNPTFKFLSEKQKEFVKIEKNKLKKERGKSNKPPRSSLQYSDDERKKLKEKLDKFLVGAMMKQTLKENLIRQKQASSEEDDDSDSEDFDFHDEL